MTQSFAHLNLVVYPDPRLRVTCKRVEAFDEDLVALAERMLDIMIEHRGVGLAAPQAGSDARLFVMNPTGEEEDDLVYVNPEILSPTPMRELEEGCLSLPEIRVQVNRPFGCTIRAQDLDGTTFEETSDDLIARIWQHETDHLDGRLIIDRMGPADKIATRQALRELEARTKLR